MTATNRIMDRMGKQGLELLDGLETITFGVRLPEAQQDVSPCIIDASLCKNHHETNPGGDSKSRI